MKTHLAWLSIALAFSCFGLDASPVTYALRDGRYFPDMPSADNHYQSGTYTPTTSDSLPFSYSTAPGSPSADTLDALSTISTGPFTLGTSNAVTIDTATTTFQNLGFYSIVQSGITETNVSVTGGSGTGYLLPTFHVSGTFTNADPNMTVGDNICAGDNTCILSSIFGTFATGTHPVDGFYTPSINMETSFQFGTPFTFFFFFGSGIQELNSLNPGGTATANLTLQFVGYQVVDASGTVIRGAQVNSQFLNPTPEPATAWTGAAALLILVTSIAIKRKVVQCKKEESYS